MQGAFNLLDDFAPELCSLPLCDGAKTFLDHHLITDDAYHWIMCHGPCCHSDLQRNEVILKDVAQSVQENPEFFEIFCDVLKSEFPTAENTANQMRGKFSSCAWQLMFPFKAAETELMQPQLIFFDHS